MRRLVKYWRSLKLARYFFGLKTMSTHHATSYCLFLLQSSAPLDFSSNPDYEPDFKFYDGSLVEAVRSNDQDVHAFFNLLALCHTVMAEERNGVYEIILAFSFIQKKLRRMLSIFLAGIIEYQAQSPDEAALVSAARNFGFVFKERTPNSITVQVCEFFQYGSVSFEK